MPTTIIAGHPVDVNDEGFLVDSSAWSEELGAELGRLIGIDLTDEHRSLLRFVREDFATMGETPTLRRVSAQTGVPIKRLFELFPKKPAKKMAYVAGVPKPKGCV